MKNLILFCISFVWALPQSFDFIPLIVENEPASTETAELHDVIEKNNPTRSGNERIPDAVDTEKGNNSEDENETVAESNSGKVDQSSVGAEKSEENKAQTNDKSDKDTPKPNDESNKDSQNPIDENDKDTPKPNDESNKDTQNPIHENDKDTPKPSDENWNEKENVEDWKTCDSSIVNPCKSQNFTCCLGALDVAENKYTCRAEGYCLQSRYRGYNKIKKN
jgi:hypothetical protein